MTNPTKRALPQIKYSRKELGDKYLNIQAELGKKGIVTRKPVYNNTVFENQYKPKNSHFFIRKLCNILKEKYIEYYQQKEFTVLLLLNERLSFRKLSFIIQTLANHPKINIYEIATYSSSCRHANETYIRRWTEK